MKYIMIEQCLAYRAVEVEAETEDEAIEKWRDGEADLLPDEEPEIDSDIGELIEVYTEEEWQRRQSKKESICQ